MYWPRLTAIACSEVDINNNPLRSDLDGYLPSGSKEIVCFGDAVGLNYEPDLADVWFCINRDAVISACLFFTISDLKKGKVFGLDGKI